MTDEVITVEEWCIVRNRDFFADPEEVLSAFIYGKGYGHPKKRDGEIIMTSKVVYHEDGLLVTASGRKYKLGLVNADYARTYRNARKRVLSAASKSETKKIL